MAKAIVEKNQAFLDKVIRENEKLILTCGKLKQELDEQQLSLTKCKQETLQSLEPKIQKLLEEHRVNMAKQKQELLNHLEINPFQQEIGKIRADTDQRIKYIEENCKKTMKEIKTKAIENESKLKSNFSTKLSGISKQIEDEGQKYKAQLEEERPSWQQARVEQLRDEYKRKLSAELKVVREKQDSLLKDAISKLKVDAKEENQELQEKLDSMLQNHRKLEKELSTKIDEKNRRISTIYQQKREREQELSILRSDVKKCQCVKLKSQIENMENQLSKLSEILNSEKQRQFSSENKIDQEKRSFEYKINSIKSDNQMLEIKIQDMRMKIQAEREMAQRKIEELRTKHQGELALIAERVKQTVAKKDDVIQQLVDRLTSLGGENDF